MSIVYTLTQEYSLGNMVPSKLQGIRFLLKEKKWYVSHIEVWTNEISWYDLSRIILKFCSYRFMILTYLKIKKHPHIILTLWKAFLISSPFESLETPSTS